MSHGDKTITLSAIGSDAPGLVWKITQRIADLGGNIVDVEEHCRRGLFAIYLEIDFQDPRHPIAEIMEKLKELEQQTGLRIILKDTSAQGPLLPSVKKRYVITVLGIDKPGIMAGISRYLATNRINIEHCKMLARGDFFSMEMVVDVTEYLPSDEVEIADAIARMKDELKNVCAQLGQSVVIQEESAHKKIKKIIVFDVESALLEEKSISAFLQALDHVLQAKGRALELSEKDKPTLETLIRNVSCLKGLSLNELQRSGQLLKLNPGSGELLKILRSMGFKIALLSSGLESLLRKLFEGMEVDYAFANTLKVDAKGHITGELEEPILTDESKAQVLEFIMNLEHAHRDQVIAIGDGSPRSGFITNAGLSIAYRPKESTVTTDGILKTDQISHILYCLGIPKVELQKYLEADTLQN